MNVAHQVILSIAAASSLAAQQQGAQSAAEFRSYVASKMPNLSEAMLKQIADRVDKNGDGTVDGDEFAGRMAAIRAVMSGEPAPAPASAAVPSGEAEVQNYLDREPTKIPPLTPDDGATILLIAGDELAEAWIPFATWKTQQGRATKIVTVREIARGYEAASIQEKIRLCVRQHIEQHGTRWVVLGGDSEPGGGSVPGGHTTYHDQEPDGIPTDIVYLSPSNWDADGDGRFGEWEDDREAITYPDGKVGLGRIPVRTIEDVAHFTAKVRAYESKYPADDFAKRMLFTSTEPMATPKVRASWDRYLEPKWRGQLQRYEAAASGEQAETKLPTVARVQAALSERTASKLHIHGHGTIGAWQLSDDDFTQAHVLELKQADVYPLITTVSCNTGEYDSARDPSIVESMLRAPGAGSVAIVAPIRTGKMHFHNPSIDFELMTSEGKLDGTTMLETRYWSEGLSKQRTTGEALMAAKAQMADEARKTGSYHLCICEINLLGDPTLDFRAEAPRTPVLKAPATLAAGKQSVTVTTGAPGAWVCLYQGNKLHAVQRVGEGGGARFEVDVAAGLPVLCTVAGANWNTQSQQIEVATGGESPR
ncbi:MAG: C25 family cysteine peptidase [Planctomycetota bacterium]